MDVLGRKLFKKQSRNLGSVFANELNFCEVSCENWAFFAARCVFSQQKNHQVENFTGKQQSKNYFESCNFFRGSSSSCKKFLLGFLHSHFWIQLVHLFHGELTSSQWNSILCLFSAYGKIKKILQNSDNRPFLKKKTFCLTFGKHLFYSVKVSTFFASPRHPTQ